MVAYTEERGFAEFKKAGAPCKPLRSTIFDKLRRVALRLWHQVRLRKSIRDLDRLNERLLKDVGLFRERLPNGSTFVRRR